MGAKTQVLAVVAIFALTVYVALARAASPAPGEPGCASSSDPASNPKCKNCTGGAMTVAYYSWANMYCAAAQWPEYDILWTYTKQPMNCSNGTGWYCGNHREYEPIDRTMPLPWWTCPTGTCDDPQQQ